MFLWRDGVQPDSSCQGVLTHLHLDVGWGYSYAKAQLGWMFQMASSQSWELMSAVTATGATDKRLHVTFPHGLGFSQHGGLSALTLPSDSWLPGGSGTFSNPIYQSSHRPRPDSREWKSRLCLLMGGWQVALHRGTSGERL